MIVRLIATSTRMMGGQPNEATSPMVIFRPRSATPTRSTNELVKRIPGLQRSFLPRKFSARPKTRANSIIGPVVNVAARPAAAAIMMDARIPGLTALTVAHVRSA